MDKGVSIDASLPSMDKGAIHRWQGRDLGFHEQGRLLDGRNEVSNVGSLECADSPLPQYHGVTHISFLFVSGLPSKTHQNVHCNAPRAKSKLVRLPCASGPLVVKCSFPAMLI